MQGEQLTRVQHVSHLVLLSIVSLAIVLLCLVIARAATSAASQTGAYYALRRNWLSLWPFPRGKGLPRFLKPFLKSSVPVWVQVEPGVRMQLDDSDLIARVILETGSWDEDTWLAMAQHLTPGATFVDIGAHDGYCSLKAARVVGPSGRVIAVEPNPEMLTILRKNIEASQAKDILVVPMACADKEGTLTLFAASQSNTGSTSLSQANATQYGLVEKSYQVPVRTLDAILREAAVSRVDVVKIDVEGAEQLVLSGALDTIKRFRPAVLIELDDLLLAPMGSSASAITEFLSAQGYRRGGQFDTANFLFHPQMAQVDAVLHS